MGTMKNISTLCLSAIARVVFFLIIIFTSNIAQSQNYNMSNADKNNVCKEPFYDTGGATNQFGNSETFEMTFCAPAGQEIQFDFTTWLLETCCDVLTIYDSNLNTGTQL